MPFNQSKADRVCDFLELLTLSDDYEGQKLKLRPFQREIIEKLFGTLRDDGYRQYEECGIWMPRKNAKSTLIAGIIVYCLFADCDPITGNPIVGKIFGAAGDQSQAKVVYDMVCQMIRACPPLAKRADIVPSQNRMTNTETGTTYKAVTREGDTLHGQNPSLFIYDEIHVVKNRRLWEAMTTGSLTRKQHLFLTITTAGNQDETKFEFSQYKLAKSIQSGAITNDKYLPIIYEAQPDDDVFDEETWHKANPALGDFLELEKFRTVFDQVKQNPVELNKVKRLHLNIHTTATTAAIDPEDWNACKAVSPPILDYQRCYVGLDIGDEDMTAIAFWFPSVEFEDGTRYSYLTVRFLITQEKFRQRILDGHHHWQAWLDAGYFELVASDSVYGPDIAEVVLESCRRYNVVEIGYDKWKANDAIRILKTENGKSCVEISPSAPSMNAPTRGFLHAIADKSFRHDGNEVLSWCARNLEVDEPNGHAIPVKPRSNQLNSKIDGCVATILAINRAQAETVSPGLQFYCG